MGKIRERGMLTVAPVQLKVPPVSSGSLAGNGDRILI